MRRYGTGSPTPVIVVQTKRKNVRLISAYDAEIRVNKRMFKGIRNLI